jgi:dolichyl-phosphate beta-glucosyltransferase
MAERIPHVSLVVPVHHCAGSLDRLFCELDRFVREASVPTELVIIDDRGSHPAASAQLQRFASGPNVRVLQNDRNRGKGYSVARGMLAATGTFRVFTDADLAYPLEEVSKIVSVLEHGADVAIACRVLPESQYTMSARYLRYIYTRHVMSRVFNKMVRLTLIPGVLDTQAGLKGYTAAAARDVFSRVRIAGFGFDLESLFVARRLGLHIEQVPVRFRYNDEPTTVRFVRDARQMAADLARIRWRGWTGEYEATPHPTRVHAGEKSEPVGERAVTVSS